MLAKYIHLSRVMQWIQSSSVGQSGATRIEILEYHQHESLFAVMMYALTNFDKPITYEDLPRRSNNLNQILNSI